MPIWFHATSSRRDVAREHIARLGGTDQIFPISSPDHRCWTRIQTSLSSTLRRGSLSTWSAAGHRRHEVVDVVDCTRWDETTRWDLHVVEYEGAGEPVDPNPVVPTDGAN
jgi:hypothetical protein